MQTNQKMIASMIATEQKVVLAQIIHVEGSAYRKEGAWMLFFADGTRKGVISGGCLENDLAARAEQLFGTGQTDVFDYDLRSEDDLGWGRGAGCNGVITVMLRDIDADFRDFLSATQKQLYRKEPVLWIQATNESKDYACLTKEGKYYGAFAHELPTEIDFTALYQQFAGQKMIDEKLYYFQMIWPDPVLYIIGAGEDARPLAQFATHVGYQVQLLDWRPTFCTEEHFPTVHALHLGDPVKTIDTIAFSQLDSVVLMTHDFERDVQLLKELRQTQLLYLGVLGSQKRTKRLLGGKIPDHIHSPIGLSIGADGPEEIALSVIAELIAVRRRKVGWKSQVSTWLPGKAAGWGEIS
ncbi:XdhC family protein [Sporosarcina sp. HYO08]|uniref:XdhC family protein n=1 Tax=Sporosarcina sp. HYO08 TaxID=1759557 RepID=UPI00079B27B3|nr:XdhC family protein [Sporosarcina sp. HYO08]KXH81747.1 hypothetical protein AU377_05640 [Sporosarcina sp. HYO08]